MLSTFFSDVFSKLPAPQIETEFIEYHVARHQTQCDVAVTAALRIVSDTAQQRHTHHVELKKACLEQKAFRDSFLKTQTDFDIDFDDADGEQDMQLLSIEDAVLIIQKLERKYQAISRRNYVRFVRERAAELHGQKVEIDATQAAIRIQARTRGYFARKQVREMRVAELNILNMTPESYIRVRLADRERKLRLETNEAERRVQQVDEVPSSLDAVLDALKTHFFLATEEPPELVHPQTTSIPPDAIFRDACFRGIVSPLAAITLDELISQPELCRIDGRSLNFDLRSFLVLTVCIPMSLSTWKTTKQRARWLLISGAQYSGKTAWARAIASACHVTHVHVSKNVVNLGKRRIYTVIKKLAKQEQRLLVSIDRIDVLKKNPKQKGFMHRQVG
uniref:Gluconate kinase n=1 Tax=Caenorhabditis japonica TaxID=281687 RepID=A0A8R1DYN6_CAEJA